MLNRTQFPASNAWPLDRFHRDEVCRQDREIHGIKRVAGVIEPGLTVMALRYISANPIIVKRIGRAGKEPVLTRGCSMQADVLLHKLFVSNPWRIGASPNTAGCYVV